jgi:hypothetical protein
VGGRGFSVTKQTFVLGRITDTNREKWWNRSPASFHADIPLKEQK